MMLLKREDFWRLKRKLKENIRYKSDYFEMRTDVNVYLTLEFVRLHSVYVKSIAVWLENVSYISNETTETLKCAHDT